MRSLSVFIITSMIAVLAIVSQQIMSSLPAPSNLYQSGVFDLIAEVNKLRAANGLPAYTVSPILMGTAQAQADYMAAIGSITHTGPGGIQVTQRLLNAGYPLAGDLSLGGFRAENITGGSNKTAAQAVQQWAGSAPHLNTMLSPNLQEIGAGVAKVGDYYYMVLNCARPTTSGQAQAYTPNPDDPTVGTSAPSDFIVPISVSTPDNNGFIYHEVQYGQTLWALAIAYEVQVDDIRDLNNLGVGISIFQGDRLQIRENSTQITVTQDAFIPSTSTEILKEETFTRFPTNTQITTPTQTETSESRGDNDMAGIAIGIFLLAIIVAGMLTWMSSRKPI